MLQISQGLKLSTPDVPTAPHLSTLDAIEEDAYSVRATFAGAMAHHLALIGVEEAGLIPLIPSIATYKAVSQTPDGVIVEKVFLVGTSCTAEPTTVLAVLTPTTSGEGLVDLSVLHTRYRDGNSGVPKNPRLYYARLTRQRNSNGALAVDERLVVDFALNSMPSRGIGNFIMGDNHVKAEAISKSANGATQLISALQSLVNFNQLLDIFNPTSWRMQFPASKPYALTQEDIGRMFVNNGLQQLLEVEIQQTNGVLGADSLSNVILSFVKP